MTNLPAYPSNQVTRPGGRLTAPELDYILLDGSGSMVDKWNEMLGGLNAFLETVRTKNLHSQGILSVFDSDDIDWVQRDDLLSNWPSINPRTVKAHWSRTPLYDAINKMGWRLRDLDPPRCSIAIVTDGLEEGSRFTTLEQAKAILDWCRAKGWQVTFIGANFNNSKQAAALGIDDSSAIGVQTQKLLEAAVTWANKRLIHSTTGEDIKFSEEERAKFGGLLTDGASRNGK